MRTRLLFAETIVIAPLDESAPVDTGRRTMMRRGAATATVTIKGQVEFFSGGKEKGDGGGRYVAIGEVTLLTADCRARDYLPKSGDRVVSTTFRDAPVTIPDELYLQLPDTYDRGRLYVIDLAARHPARRA